MVDLSLLISLWWLWILILVCIILGIAFSIYTIVPANEAHVVIQGGKRRIFSSDLNYNKTGSASYYHVPSWFPGFGMKIHKMPLGILSIAVPEFLAWDTNRARFTCEIRAFVVIHDPVTAAMRFPSNETLIDIQELGIQISKIVEATMRDSTTKKNIREIINNRQGIIDYIKQPLSDVLSSWGLTLTDIELINFSDPTKAEFGEKEPPHVVRDISVIEEVKINSEMRRKNAEEIKLARLTEAENEEIAKKREIERDEMISKREQEKNKFVAEKQKDALEKELEVERTRKTVTQDIEKQRAVIEANQKKAVEEINKLQKKLIGEGDRLMKEEQAKGEAAPIREKGYADADAKEKLQSSLNKFGDAAIRALVAEKVVDMQKEVGIASAKALEKADLRVFSGGGSAASGFELGKLVEGIRGSSDATAMATMNRLARPNDLGFKELLGAFIGASDESKKDNSVESKTSIENKSSDASDDSEKSLSEYSDDEYSTKDSSVKTISDEDKLRRKNIRRRR